MGYSRAPIATEKGRLQHHKTQSRAILRILGSASYLNGSHFAILWVNSAGQHELFSSDLFQPKLDQWFPRSTLADASEIVKRDRAQREATERMEEGCDVNHHRRREEQVWDESGKLVKLFEDSSRATGMVGGAEIDAGREGSAPNQWERQQQQQDPRSRPFSDSAPAKGTTPSDTTPGRPGPSSSLSLITPQHLPTSSNRVTRSSHSSTDPGFSSPSLSSPGKNALGLTLVTFTPQSLAAWYTEKFSAWQDKTCKTVCKLWVRVVEPKKQTLYPYLKGDPGRPTWWPPQVRHKEPDHLVKPERVVLLATMLRTTGIPVEDFELATESSVAFISQKGILLLREIYKVAKAERLALEASNNAPFASLQVLLPTPSESPTVSPDFEDSDTFDGPVSRTRHRASRSVTTFKPEDLVSSRPRDANRPYPISRSNSINDGSLATISPTLSSSSSQLPSSRPLARSHSLSTSTTVREKPARSRRGGNSLSTLEVEDRPRTAPGGDVEMNPPGSASSGTFYSHEPLVAHHSTPALAPPITLHSLNPGETSEGRPRSSNSQESPSGRLPISPSEGFPPSSRSHEPSFASPAMIKSRSRLGQQPMMSIAESPQAPRARVYGQPPQPQAQPQHTPVPLAFSRPSAQEEPRQQPLLHYPSATSYPAQQLQYPVPVHAGHNIDPYFYASGYPPTPTYPPQIPSPVNPQYFTGSAFGSPYTNSELSPQILHGFEEQLQQQHALQLNQQAQQQIDPQQFALLGLEQLDMQGSTDDQSSWGYFTPESQDGGMTSDAQAMAYIQQLSNYEQGRQQEAHLSRALQDQNSGLGFSEMEQRREAERRRYHEHVFGQVLPAH